MTYLCVMLRKNKTEILNKLGIESLNSMQEEAHKLIPQKSEIILLSSTGTGKTLAFLLPVIENLNHQEKDIQTLIIVPTRELAIQIEQVIREMGSGYKTNAVYGGRSGSKDRLELKTPPTILVGTPGRVADHLRRESFSAEKINTLVLDEFDKSLEMGFEKEMKEIIGFLPKLEKKILSSATQKVRIPGFVGMKQATILDFLDSKKENKLKLKSVISPTKNKLFTLKHLLGHIEEGNGIIFCNLKDTIQVVSGFFKDNNIQHSCFYGGMEQIDREQSLIKFRNGTHKILLSTDLAARGLDIPKLDFIIHYQLPNKEEEFIHRNGRTARMQEEGVAYILSRDYETLPDFVKDAEIEEISIDKEYRNSKWKTLYISGGRKDKISKSDIAGLFFKQGELEKEELGLIELKKDCAFVSVPRLKAYNLAKLLNNTRLKSKKIRVSSLT